MARDTGDAADVIVGGLDGRTVGGRFHVLGVVSSGANTVIADAHDTETNQPVTLKVVRPELAESEEFRRAFRRHAEVATALSHPNIAAVIGWGEVDLGDVASVFWVVEHLGGGSMRDLFDRGRLLEPSQALVVGLEACRALDVAHQRGIVHTELTPSKMVFGDDRRLRIVDFGFARLLGAPAWADPATLPTHVARYASPEQALGMEVDAKTDVYALTLSMIEAVTGSVPFGADSTVATLAARVGKLMPVSADLGSLAAVLERAGRPDADDRSTAAELGKGLVQAASKLPRPDPIPIVAGGLFATSELRRPTDPTGGLARPAAADEPGSDDRPADDPGEAGGAPSVGAVVGGAAAAAAVAGAAGPPPAAEVGAGEAGGSESASGVPDGAGAVASGSAADERADEVAGDAADAEAAPAPAEGARPLDGALANAEPRAASDDAGPPEDGPAGVAGDVARSGPPDDATGEAHGSAPGGAVAGTHRAPVVTEDDGAGADEPAASSDGAGVVADPLIVLTDVADPPTGAVQVGKGEAAASNAAANAAAATQQMVIPPPEQPAVYDDERRRPSIGKILLLTLVVLSGLAALSYAGWLLLRTKSFEVPVLAGVNQDVALNEIAGNGWVITIDRERDDAEPTIDNVIRTVPGPGTDLEEGGEILIVVSDGPELRTLPELAGQPLTVAQSTLGELRLVPLVDARQFSETVPLDAVISWRVQGDEAAAAGSQVLPETTILLTVSDGPAPRPVPALSGLLAEQATTEVESLQLVLARGDDVFSDTVPVGVVVSQEPAAGTLVPRGGTVTILVSKGPDVVPLPALDGLSYADAEALLLETGFTIGNLLGTTEGSFVSLTIDGESVEVGTLFRRGTAVDLIFL